MKVLGIIPARGSSKTIQRKNLKKLGSRPLIYYAIKNALESKKLDRVIVSTEDKEIAEVAKKYGAEVPFLRPKKLARDNVSLIPVVIHAMRYLEKKEGWKADVVVSIQPTSPFLEAEDIDRAISKLIRTRCDSVVTICKLTHGHPYWAYRLKNGKLEPLFRYGSKYLQKQDLPPFYSITGGLYVRWRKLLENWSGSDFALGKNIGAIILDEIKAIDIDTPIDFAIAETVKKKISINQNNNHYRLVVT